MRRREKQHKDFIPVWIVEYNGLAARYLEGLLKRKRELKIVTDPDILKPKSGQKTCDLVLVIDAETLPMPLSGYLHSVRGAFPSARILVTAAALSRDELCRLLLLGIRGFISYDELLDQLPQAINTAWEGRLWASPEVLEQFALYMSRLSQTTQGKQRSFTSREEIIIGLLQRRLSNKEIGYSLGISERTVRFHLGNIFSKLGVRDRHSVVELARLRSPDEAVGLAHLQTEPKGTVSRALGS